MRNDCDAEKKEEKRFLAATSSLGESTKKGHNCVRKDTMTDFGIASKDLPSCHLMTKFCPNFTLFNVSPSESFVKVECNDQN